MVVRLLLQQAASASLTLPEGEVLEVGGHCPALVCYVCFLKEATKEVVARAAKAVLATKLTEAVEGERRADIGSSGGEVLVVPQATLGGKLKKGIVQYHGNIGPEEGRELYRQFCQELVAVVGEARVKEGQFGARQVLSMVTRGPYSHTFDIS